MNKNYQNQYNLFLRFIDANKSSAFQKIDIESALMKQIEIMNEENNQFFYVADVIGLNMIYTSKRSKDVLGVESKDFNPSTSFSLTSPKNSKRHNLARTKLIKMGNEIYFMEQGQKLISTTLSLKNVSGNYSDFLFQGYMFYSAKPYKTVFMLMVITDVSWFKKIKYGYHYYVGNDMNLFKFPDVELLMTGNVFSEREFEIIKLIETGLNSREIAEKMFLSIHTIETHRRNIIRKTGKQNTSELIFDLKERGLL